MKTLLALFVTMFLFGCASNLKYTANPNLSRYDAKAVIEQVIMEQHPSRAPGFVEVTDEYIAYGGGAVRSRSIAYVSGGVAIGSGGGHQDNGRVYFSSIGDVQLYKRKSWFVVQINDHDDNLIKNFYSKSKTKAARMVDAVVLLRKDAPDLFSGDSTANANPSR